MSYFRELSQLDYKERTNGEYFTDDEMEEFIISLGDRETEEEIFIGMEWWEN